jgi:two-component system, NtrC family, sensor kinase
LLVALDDGKLQQVIVNLAINAVQASPSKASVELAVVRTRATRPHSDAEGDHVRIDVIDHGTGIAPEHLHRVFEPFFTTKPVGEGTGLGLAVSYGIVDEHDGWIEVANNDGGGSRFSVFLPLVAPT